METLNEQAVDNFCKYLRIETVQPNPDYYKAVEFLKEQSVQLQLDFEVFELFPNNPIVILKWKGINNNIQSIVLNSHMDVVPVIFEKWKYHPFGAHIDVDGNIYARGSQDMKCVGIQYLEAIRRIKTFSPNYVPKRNIYIMFVPDEELGGQKGMKLFVETELFKQMNIGVMMDEGIANTSDEYCAFYGQRAALWLKVLIQGEAGHGSQFIRNSAGSKMRVLLNKFMDFREAEESRMINQGLTLGDVTTVNLTGVHGGVQHNVVPDQLSMNFDIRITPTVDLTELQKLFESWADEAGGGIQFDTISQTPQIPSTCTDESNPWWSCFQTLCESLDMKIVPQIFPASTDCRFVRLKGISGIGFSPINRTPILLHDHDEFLNTGTFIRGIGFYEKLIPVLAAVKTA